MIRSGFAETKVCVLRVLLFTYLNLFVVYKLHANYSVGLDGGNVRKKPGNDDDDDDDDDDENYIHLYAGRRYRSSAPAMRILLSLLYDGSLRHSGIARTETCPPWTGIPGVPMSKKPLPS